MILKRTGVNRSDSQYTTRWQIMLVTR